ncbi:hypothetical protein SANTM175S_09132 [Streptomyces antimycoticus]
MDLSIVAWGRDRGTPGVAGALIAVFGLGSALGGLLSIGRGGKRSTGLGALGLAAGIGVLALLLPPVSDATPVWLLAVMMVVAGSVVAPSMAANNAQIGELAPEARRAEAFGWLATAMTGGAAIMLSLSGTLLDVVGPSASIGSGAVAALLAAGLAFSLPKRVVEPGDEPEAEAAAPAAEAS